MEPTRTPLPIAEQVKHYLEIKFRLLKYEGIDKASTIIAEAVTDVIMAVLLLITFIFLTITLALFAGRLLDSEWEGFGCVTVLYVIILLSVRFLQVSIQNLVVRRFIEKLFRKSNA